MAAITPDTFQRLQEKVPMAHALGIRALSIGEGEARLLMPFGPALVRPVNVVSGPALMTLADVAVWAAVLSVIGPKEMAVTTNLHMHFLRKAEATDIIAEARVLKMGRRLAVAAVELIAVAQDEMVAHATAGYAIPE